MVNNRHYIKILVGLVLWVAFNLSAFGFSPFNNYPGINPKVLALGLKAYQYAASTGKVSKSILVIVDYTIKSSKKRLWVLDLKHKKVLANFHVAHGKGSGSVLMATTFSNRPGSKASSLGTYVTGNDYIGGKGRSLRLYGLEKGINDAAFKRTIVLHPAWYVSKSFRDKQGYSGRSYGCFAVNPKVSNKLINTIEDGSVLFAYAPQIENDPNLS